MLLCTEYGLISGAHCNDPGAMSANAGQHTTVNAIRWEESMFVL